eukprot:18611-Pyramimonas_sp.AAC.1
MLEKLEGYQIRWALSSMTLQSQVGAGAPSVKKMHRPDLSGAGPPPMCARASPLRSWPRARWGKPPAPGTLGAI